jgi:hypothetical protein
MMMMSVPRPVSTPPTEWRGGILMITRRIPPARTASSLAAVISKCQFSANGVRGLSSWKQCCAKLAKSARSSASYSPGLCVPAVVIALSSCYVLPPPLAGRGLG